MLTVSVNVNGEASFPVFFWLCSRSRSWKSFAVLTINVNVEHGQRRPIRYDWWGLLTCKISNRVIFELMTVGHDYPTHFLHVSTRSNIFFRSRTHSGSVWGRGPSQFKRNWERRRVTPFMYTYTDLTVNSVDVYADDRLRSRSRSGLASAWYSIDRGVGIIPGGVSSLLCSTVLITHLRFQVFVRYVHRP